jgi:gibberellin 2-oxidase
MPHTDTSFLTILYQDQVGGLQLMKDGKWFLVKPNPQALVINFGDLFQVCCIILIMYINYSHFLFL